MTARVIDRKAPAACPRCSREVRHGDSRVIILEGARHVALCEHCGYDRETEERRAHLARLVPHPVLSWFPVLDEPGLAHLSFDLQLNGLRDPIVVHGDQLLDGRARLRGCELAGLEPELEEWSGDESEIAAWIVSRNLHRRHLTTSQRSMMASRLKEEWANLPTAHRPTGTLRDLVAGLLNVSPRSVTAADQVRDSGDAELVAQVDAGDLAVSTAAELVRAPARVELAAPRPDSLPNDERAPFDAYWTPDHVAAACMRWLLEHVELPEDFTAIESAVGGGGWVRGIREVAPRAVVDRMDLDHGAPGLAAAHRGGEQSWAGRSWLDPLPEHGFVRRREWDLCPGNRPWHLPIAEWVERSIERARIVALLERVTVTGDNMDQARVAWWKAHRPAWIAAVEPRPKWEGPGARPASDMVGTVLVVWVRGVTDTRWDWIEHARGRS